MVGIRQKLANSLSKLLIIFSLSKFLSLIFCRLYLLNTHGAPSQKIILENIDFQLRNKPNIVFDLSSTHIEFFSSRTYLFCRRFFSVSLPELSNCFPQLAIHHTRLSPFLTVMVRPQLSPSWTVTLSHWC